MTFKHWNWPSASKDTWAWYSEGKTWPGFDIRDQDNAGFETRNTSLIGRDAYTDITWKDRDRDGVIRDNDTDDCDYNSDRILGGYHLRDSVQVGGRDRMVHEIASYNDSSVMVNGKEIKVPVSVFIFTDGTYMMRLQDQYIPKGVSPDDIGRIKLGHWDRHEYVGASVKDHDDPFVCFASDTMIDTDTGPRAVGDLVAGDLVMTLDGGLVPLRWVGRRTVAGKGPMAPVEFATGALGNDAPLRVSQHHRMLIAGWRAQLVVGEDEVLVAAKHLTNDASIRIVECDSVTWVHLLFDTHQIVRTSGVWSESFHPGVQSDKMVDDAQRAEIVAIFPELDEGFEIYGPSARPQIKAYEARALFA